MKDYRKIVTTIDTDSNFINANNYIIFLTKKLSLDKKNEEEQMAILNLIINVVTKVLEVLFNKVGENKKIPEKYRSIINMKNEFIYKRLLLTYNKKQYSGIITGELGKLLKKPSLDIKGLSIKKTNIAKKIRTKFTEILKNDILQAENIDIKTILEKYDDLIFLIRDSLEKRETTFSLPKNLEKIETYKIPESQESIRGTLIWNALEPEEQIDPPEKINMLKLKETTKDSPEMQALKLTHPEKYDTILRVVFNEGVSNPKIDISHFNFNCICFPKTIEEIPEYLIPFIDFEDIGRNNISNGYILLESLGIYIDSVRDTPYKSNIISM